MPPPPPPRAARAPAPAPPPAAPPRRFRFVLLAYAGLTTLAFALVWRYTQHLAALYGGNIDNVGLQFGLYFGIYAVATPLAHAAVRRLPLHLGREGALRLAFVGGATLAVIVALYQSRFGWTSLVNYFTVGVLGAFAAVLYLTHRQFGLVEVVARPAPEVVAAVEAAHAAVRLADTPGDRVKRVLELALAVVIMGVSLPISLALAVAVWLQDPGPLLVAKVAVKQGGRSFNQLKLRSMVKDAEGGTGPVPAAPTDARVTRLGNLLRRTHIDELPQLINIAVGDMSLVGPRPERTVFVARHLREIPRYAERHAVRPGLAGLAQVYGDYYSTPREKLRYDLLYIRNRGLGLDARLFAEAVVLALFGVAPRRRVSGAHPAPGDEQRFRRAYRALRGEDVRGGDAGEGMR
ncbi:hypothetical protein DCC79_13600 [bacterium]|nr:MAG: hypothetical protein DCC79_13600 [bacterium]